MPERLFRTYPGRSPKKPETIEDAVDEVITQTESWLRRYGESWFDHRGVHALDFEYNVKGDLSRVIGQCDNAIKVLVLLSKHADQTRQHLEKLKKMASKLQTERARDAKKSRTGPKKKPKKKR